MVVIVVSSVPDGLRGYLSRYLYEVASGVYVGEISGKVREHLWDMLEIYRKNGLVIMVFPNPSIESRIEVRQLGGEWESKDMEGVKIPFRPAKSKGAAKRSGWSKASKYRRK